MKKKIPVILLNFTGVYELEAFASNKNMIHVDCRDMKGVDCYCDEEAREELHRRLAPFPAKAVHFIDSGDFHYLTEYWVSRIHEPFSLIVFDHHPDMQQPEWEGGCVMWRLGERCFGEEPVCQTRYHCGGIGRVDSPGACSLKREGVVLQSGRDRPSPGLAVEGR